MEEDTTEFPIRVLNELLEQTIFVFSEKDLLIVIFLKVKTLKGEKVSTIGSSTPQGTAGPFHLGDLEIITYSFFHSTNICILSNMPNTSIKLTAKAWLPTPFTHPEVTLQLFQIVLLVVTSIFLNNAYLRLNL